MAAEHLLATLPQHTARLHAAHTAATLLSPSGKKQLQRPSRPAERCALTDELEDGTLQAAIRA